MKTVTLDMVGMQRDQLLKLMFDDFASLIGLLFKGYQPQLRCDRKGSYQQSELVKAFGAALSFKRLRRRAALGCEHMTGLEGDWCATRFPCLEGLAKS
ncbi:hypothetical protein ACXHXG_28955 [Rhizobium sp. LEGMi198b]